MHRPTRSANNALFTSHQIEYHIENRPIFSRHNSTNKPIQCNKHNIYLTRSPLTINALCLLDSRLAKCRSNWSNCLRVSVYRELMRQWFWRYDRLYIDWSHILTYTMCFVLYKGMWCGVYWYARFARPIFVQNYI